MCIPAIDIGGTMIKSGCWNGASFSHVRECPTLAHGGSDALMKQVKEIIHTCIEQERGKGRIKAIGVSTAGQVNFKQGSIIYANDNIPGYTGTDVRQILEAEFHIPVAVENDVNAAALGELHFGAGRGFKDLLCLTYGTGVGGAVVLGGGLYRGSSFSAGEFGGMVLHPEDRREGEPFSGCYEQYASVSALVKRVSAFEPMVNSGKKIFTRLNDPEIKAIIDSWIDEIVYGLINLVHIFNPSCIILGGGVMGQEYVFQTLERSLRSQIMESFGNVVIRRALLKNQAGMMGAAWLAEQLANRPFT